MVVMGLNASMRDLFCQVKNKRLILTTIMAIFVHTDFGLCFLHIAG